MSLHSYHVSKKVLKSDPLGLLPEDGPVDKAILARQIRELNA